MTVTEHPEKMQARVALLIDADIINSEHAEFLLKRAESYGSVNIKRAYGTFRPGGFPWKKDILHKYGIKPVGHHTYIPRKNVTDIALVIEAMDLMHREHADVFCLATGDSDFTLLAARLREEGVKVYGFGPSRHAMESFAASCDDFIAIPQDDVQKSSEQTDQPDAAGAFSCEMSPENMRRIVTNLVVAYDKHRKNDGWASLAPVGNHLIDHAPDCTAQKQGYKNLTEMVKATGEFEVSEEKPPKIRKKAYNRPDTGRE